MRSSENERVEHPEYVRAGQNPERQGDQRLGDVQAALDHSRGGPEYHKHLPPSPELSNSLKGKGSPSIFFATIRHPAHRQERGQEPEAALEVIQDVA